MREADSRIHPPIPTAERLFAAVSRAAADVAQEVELEPTLHRIVAGAHTHLGFDRADVLLYERDRGQITRLVGVDGAGNGIGCVGTPKPIGTAKSAVREVVLGRVPFVHGDAERGGRGIAEGRPEVIVPLAAHGEILGALVVDNGLSGEPIPDSAISPLCLYGLFSAAAVSNALQRRRLQRVQVKLSRLAQACNAMAGFLDTEALFHALLPAMREMLDADRYAVWHRPPEGSWRCLAYAGLSESHLDRLRQLHAGLETEGPAAAARLFRSGQVIVVGRMVRCQASSEPACGEATALLPPEGESSLPGGSAVLGLPVIHGGELVGTLYFVYDDPARLGSEAIQLAEMFAGFAAAITVAAGLTQHELHQAEAHKKQFYRDIVYAVTNGKLNLCEPGEIEEHWERSLAEQVVETDFDIKRVRDLVRQIGEGAGMAEGRVEDLCLCASEAATNALKHAGGGRAWVDHNDTLVRLRVVDAGAGIDPLQLPRATLMRGYSTRASMGLGFTLMHELADRIYLHTGPQGTVLILEMSIRPVSETERMLALMNWVE
jgi:GAF domain-containing protein